MNLTSIPENGKFYLSMLAIAISDILRRELYALPAMGDGAQHPRRV